VRSIVCDQYGSIDDLRIVERDTPSPGAGEVLIAVRGAGINFADSLMVKGTYQETPEPPFTPGMEVAGEVMAVGEDVHRVAPGERVLAVLSHGGFADVAVARAEDVFVLPAAMDDVTAAGFPITYGTAHGALVWRAGLRHGETLVVHGAAGGAGLAAVEVGKALGARVIATAGGPEKCAIAAQHGADRTIDYKSEDLRARVKALTDGRGADVIYDPVGGDIFDASMRCVAWSGRIVVIGFASGTVPQVPANILLVKNVAVLGLHWGSYRKHAPQLLHQQFVELFRWYESGLLHPLVGETHPLDEVRTALRRLKSRESRGKVVLKTGPQTK
jgi:NADPH2:quinone reductase